MLLSKFLRKWAWFQGHSKRFPKYPGWKSVDERALIKTTLIYSSHWKTVVPFCLRKERPKNTFLTLTVNYYKNWKIFLIEKFFWLKNWSFSTNSFKRFLVSLRRNQVNFLVYRQDSKKIGSVGRQTKNNIIWFWRSRFFKIISCIANTEENPQFIIYYNDKWFLVLVICIRK